MKEYDGTEADAMDDSGYEVELDPSCEEYKDRQRERAANREIYRQTQATTLAMRYTLARAAKVGSTIKCPVCQRSFVKTTYNKVFCSNQRTTKRGKNSCKDQYHNTTNPRGIGILMNDDF